ncbi:polyketide biosynthesis enoyl-CoA hydratase PksH [Streptomyces zhaozhouensis]|uniref:Polyketide biosynthesis enoyl-CoA hydratase PksH n=1 Tax=Streptomyces zhaozhouensis TaxID=1300267 RepID=A0A286E060_9ACTN|nr:enoyl-CoA hydratase/isomerase [Streptomyces zhaozhouensis]SOD64273.1 polyketide biosynthesis enoyl-CoA hydratase PksH [Streptomyces zhaozhouensis]
MIRGRALDATVENGVCRVRFNRPEARNTITPDLIAELGRALDACEERAVGVVVVEGGDRDFCFGADLDSVAAGEPGDADRDRGNVDALYDLWLRMATGPQILVAHVRGRANAGGVGFVAASDVVIADDTATFGLSELLFGLYPAMVLPFLTRRVGFGKAHYMTLMTRPVPAARAAEWGLVDAHGPRGDQLLLQHLGRLRRIPPETVGSYKRYMGRISPVALEAAREPAVRANLDIFSDPANLRRVTRFVEDGVYPWEASR